MYNFSADLQIFNVANNTNFFYNNQIASQISNYNKEMTINNLKTH